MFTGETANAEAKLSENFLSPAANDGVVYQQSPVNEPSGRERQTTNSQC